MLWLIIAMLLVLGVVGPRFLHVSWWGNQNFTD
jgi:hypothetical protein